jgi:putative FmdB family regulatory protein
MPIYEYMCNSCGTRNEFLEGVSQERQEQLCVECGSTDLHKLISLSSFTISSSAPRRAPMDDCGCDGGGGCGCGGACGHHH